MFPRRSTALGSVLRQHLPNVPQVVATATQGEQVLTNSGSGNGSVMTMVGKDKEFIPRSHSNKNFTRNANPHFSPKNAASYRQYNNTNDYVNHRAPTYYLTNEQANAMLRGQTDHVNSNPHELGKRAYSSSASTLRSSVPEAPYKLQLDSCNIHIPTGFQDGTPYFLDPSQPDLRPEVYVDTEDKLEELLVILRKSDRIALDLEFTSYPVYRPILQLLQVSTKDTIVAIIDCQVLQGQLSSLFQLITEKEVILHGGSKDLEILHGMELEYDFPCIPGSLVDTQVAASFVGIGDGQSISLGNLMRELIDVHMDKGLGLSDWARRPLSNEQIAYALDDVRYLHYAYDVLLDRMRHMTPIPSNIINDMDSKNNILNDKHVIMLNRESLFRSEMEMLRLSKHDTINPDHAWTQVKVRPGQLTKKNQYHLQCLAKWREIEGIKLNKNPKFLIKDEILVSISMRPPKDVTDLDALGYSGAHLVKKSEEVLSLFRAIDNDDISNMINSTSHNYVQHPSNLFLDKKQDAMRALMQAVANAISQAVAVTVDLIAPSNELKSFVTAETLEAEDATEIMRGFRRELLGIHLRKLKQGIPVNLRWDTIDQRLTF